MPNGQLKEKVVVEPHPGGAKGAMMSLDKVAEKMWASRNDPRIRAWTTQQLAKAGNPTGAREKMQVVLDAYRAKVPYVSDPVQTEFMAGPVQTLCLDDHGLCIVGGDCDDATITVGACLLSIGIPVQVVGASYKEPTTQPTHVYLQAQDDAGEWVPMDATTKFDVGNVHEPARTWIVEPNKGVGAAGLQGGDFVGVGRPPLRPAPWWYVQGLGRPQGVGQDPNIEWQRSRWWMSAPSLESEPDYVFGKPVPGSEPGGPEPITPDVRRAPSRPPTRHPPPSWYVRGLGQPSPPGVIPPAAQGAYLPTSWGYPKPPPPPPPPIERGVPIGPQFYKRYQGATPSGVRGPVLRTTNPCPAGQVPHPVNAYAYTCVPVGVGAPAAIAPPPSWYRGPSPVPAHTGLPSLIPPGQPVIEIQDPDYSNSRIPSCGIRLAGTEWGALSRNGRQMGLGVGLVTPGDILSYRALWNQYVMDTVGSANSCAQAFASAAAKQTDVTTKSQLTAWGQGVQTQADALQAQWNLYQNKEDSFFVLQGASVLQQFQQTVLSAGQVRQNLTTSTLTCSLSYVNSKGQLVQAAPGADPNVQVQVIARIEGLGILAGGVLQILMQVTGNTLEEVGSATQWLASQVNKTTNALSSAAPWIALTVIAGAVIVYEVWPRK